MEDIEFLPYVEAAARLAGLPLTGERARAVADHLGRTAVLARLLDEVELAPEDEPAEVYRPATFPAADPEGAA